MVLVVKNMPANAGDARDIGSIPGSGRFPRLGNGTLLQYFCQNNSMDRGAWCATLHVATKSRMTEHTRTRAHTHTHTHTHTYTHTHTPPSH